MTVLDLSTSGDRLLARAEERRASAALLLDEDERSQRGQFFTPHRVAALMAGMVEPIPGGSLRILDPGAGSGVLTSALVKTICEWPAPPAQLDVTAFEIDRHLEPALRETLVECEALCTEHGIEFRGAVRIDDFLRSTARTGSRSEGFDVAILNPPYRKIRSDSEERALARELGAETPNLYAAFMVGAIVSLAPGGQLVAITPRSFTNGTYFRRFRRFLLAKANIAKLHVFDSRDRAFQEDGVLQENLVMHAIRGADEGREQVLVSASKCAAESHRRQVVARGAVVDDDDPEVFIRLPVDEDHVAVASVMAGLPASLEDLGLQVSTGPVVDFRLRRHLRARLGADAVPLLYPASIRRSGIAWPAENTRKPSAISRAACNWLVPDGDYVLVRRFTAKEEERRVVVALLKEGQLGFDELGLENHLNYFHQEGKGIDPRLARGLTTYLNSLVVDKFVRLFSGHTQINASDLRSLRYPSISQLHALAKRTEHDRAAEQRIAGFSRVAT